MCFCKLESHSCNPWKNQKMLRKMWLKCGFSKAFAEHARGEKNGDHDKDGDCIGCYWNEKY